MSIRAAMAETLETSEHTSLQRRIQALQHSEPSKPYPSQSVDSFLSPLTIDERHDSLGACANQTRERCSDKGFLSMPIADYLEQDSLLEIEPPGADPHAGWCGRGPRAIRAPIPVRFVRQALHSWRTAPLPDRALGCNSLFVDSSGLRFKHPCKFISKISHWFPMIVPPPKLVPSICPAILEC